MLWYLLKINKWKLHSETISDLYNELFRWLPLASLIDNQIYVVHGGLSEKTLSLKDMMKIKREKYISVIQSPILNERNAFINSLNVNDLTEWGLVSKKLILQK